jgi:type 1 glutamine amidotransferase
VELLLSLDPDNLGLTNPKVNLQDMIFPVSWGRSHGHGRVFYTALGDWELTWKDPRYQARVTNGI